MNTKLKTGVVIGRFQTDKLHLGHLSLFQQVTKNNDQLVILIGEAPVPLTDKNPLNFQMRKEHLQLLFPNAHIQCLHDVPLNDDTWSQQVDMLLEPFENVTIYGGSHDSCIGSYKGKHKVEAVKQLCAYNATEIRKQIKQNTFNDPKFRAGVIYATQNTYPTAYPTVDIAVLRLNPDKTIDLLLGRKKNEPLYRFVGGFVDPADKCLELAAHRELSEEVLHMDTHEFKYVCSKKIHDPRYFGTRHGIMTSFFVTYYLSGNPKASDDIEEIKWFNIIECADKIMPQYLELFTELLKYISNEKKLNN